MKKYPFAKLNSRPITRFECDIIPTIPLEISIFHVNIQTCKLIPVLENIFPKAKLASTDWLMAPNSAEPTTMMVGAGESSLQACQHHYHGAHHTTLLQLWRGASIEQRHTWGKSTAAIKCFSCLIHFAFLRHATC